MRGYGKFLVALVLILVPALCLADDPIFPSSPLWDMFKNLSYDPGPKSMALKFLAKMYGPVAGVSRLAGAGNTIMGVIFGVFNAGVMGISGMFLTYTVTKIITETTMDGAAMGKSTTIWTAVRCSLSTGLLVPQASGYSLINGIVMWIVIQGIGLADYTWKTALDYLSKGGTMYAPAVAIVDYSLINSVVTADVGAIDDSNAWYHVGTADILNSLVCAHAVKAALIANQDVNRQKYTNMLQSGTSLSSAELMEFTSASTTIPSEKFAVYKEYDPTHNAKGNIIKPGAYYFPYAPDLKHLIGYVEKGALKPGSYGIKLGSNTAEAKANTTSITNAGITGMCGVIGYAPDLARGERYSSSSYKKRYNRYASTKKSALDDAITKLEPIAIKLLASAKNLNVSDTQSTILPSVYVLYQDDDGNDAHLIINAAPDDSLVYASKNRTFDQILIKDAIEDLPTTINWPYAVDDDKSGDDMLGAAAGYQAKLLTVQTESAQKTKEEAQKKIQVAGDIGWIGAAGYWELLLDLSKSVKAEYNAYRLTAYAINGNPLGDSSSRNFYKGYDGDPDFYYSVLFKRGIRFIDRKNTKNVVGLLDDATQGYLDRALTWIELVMPYAKLRGQVLTQGQASVEDINTGFTASTLSALTVLANPMVEDAIIAQEVGGAVLLALPTNYQIIGVGMLMGIPLEWLYYDAAGIFKTWQQQMGPENATTDPITKLRTLGDAMMKGAVAYIFHMFTFVTTVSASLSLSGFLLHLLSFIPATCTFEGVCVGVGQVIAGSIAINNGILEIMQMVVFTNLPIGLAVMGPMFVSGAVLSIYVPLIPYLLFLFGTISWFISVLVLMAAAPIICFLMLWGNSSQENPLLAREAEDFVKQLVGVFFRPTLMIIGLVAGVVLSYIGVDVLNLGFNNVVTNIAVSSDPAVALFKQVMVTVVYTFVMVNIVNACFSTIYLLYQEAMKIAGITAPALGMEQPALESVKGTVSQYAEHAASGMKEKATSIKGKGTFQGVPVKDRTKEKGGADKGAKGGQQTTASGGE